MTGSECCERVSARHGVVLDHPFACPEMPPHIGVCNYCPVHGYERWHRVGEERQPKLSNEGDSCGEGLRSGEASGSVKKAIEKAETKM